MRQPDDRQILISLGNRYVVFGSGVSLPDRRQLGPEDVAHVYARVADERDGVERRIVESLVVEGFEVQIGTGTDFGDVTIVDQNGQSALIEIKTGDRDFAGLNLGQAWDELAQAAEKGERREIWGINLERLGLGIVWSEGALAPGFVQLPALNVWAYNKDGTVFQRQDVVDRVEDWSRRIEDLYAEIEVWALASGFAVTRNRSVPMSEELMQRFAVSDRDLCILDIASGNEPIASFVPVGLWLIGFDGLISVITRSGTFKLGGRASVSNSPDWVLTNPKDRSMKPWNQDEFRSVLGLVPADE